MVNVKIEEDENGLPLGRTIYMPDARPTQYPPFSDSEDDDGVDRKPKLNKANYGLLRKR